jgi:hypothetical protein
MTDPARSAPLAQGGGDPAALSGDDIALLSDIGGMTALMEDEATAARIARLVAQGFVRRDGERAKEGLRLTRKAEDFLVARGAGLNEA